MVKEHLNEQMFATTSKASLRAAMKRDRKHQSPLFQLLSFIRSYFTGPATRRTDSDGSLASSISNAGAAAESSETTLKQKDKGELFVVWDALGDGRAVGIFESEDLVRQILAINPFYYRYYRCKPGQATQTALEWLDEKQRADLLQLLYHSQIPEKSARQRPATDGVIRTAEPTDLDRLTELWLSASLEAHNFISSDFWQQNSEKMRHKYLPASENWVYCENDRILGFFSLFNDNLAALFVDPAAQSRGIGRKLLDHAKVLRPNLSLNVYEQNIRAVSFYSRNGFRVIQAQKDPHTGHSELLMQFSA